MSSLLRESVLKPVALSLLTGVLIVAVWLAAGGKHDTPATHLSASDKWTCSMCPQFILSDPGKCPKCFMDLIPLEGNALAGSRLELVLTPEAAELAGIRTVVAESPEEKVVSFSTSGEEPSPVAVPPGAVLENLDRSFVYVESYDGENITFAMREITVAGRSGEMLLVVSGLDEGEAVAVDGTFRIDSAMQILGKVSLVNLPDGDLADADNTELPPYQPSERSDVDLRTLGVPVDDLFSHYEALRAALAGDNLEKSRQPARRLLDALSNPPLQESQTDFAALRRELSAAALDVDSADSLDSKRDSFEKLSAGMVLLARRYGSPQGGLNLVFCPMAFGGAGAYWLQPMETVDNPYHGLEMPLCGWPVERIADSEQEPER